MSGFSSQGVGAGLCAKADVESAVSAAAIKSVLVENPVIIAAPGKLPNNLASANFLNKSRTLRPRQYDGPIGRSTPPTHCDFAKPSSRLSCGFGLEAVFAIAPRG
jgi:hypothetical protein